MNQSEYDKAVLERDNFQATKVTYDKLTDCLVITVLGEEKIIPRTSVVYLSNLTPEDMENLELWPDGNILAFEKADVHVSVNGLIRSISDIEIEKLSPRPS